MTLDILKPTTVLSNPSAVEQEGIDALVAGLVNGTITGPRPLAKAVKAVNDALGTNIGGNLVGPYFNELYRELKAFDAEADRLAREGKTIGQIATALNNYIAAKDIHFVIADLQAMKVEVYGSVALWLEAMNANTEV
jgi:hypothetical protein